MSPRGSSPSADSPSVPVMTRLARAFRADERATDAAGWALNLAIFRIAYLSLGVLPLAVDTWRWTRRALPGLHPDLWVRVSFFRSLPLSLTTDAVLGQALAVVLIALVTLGVLGYRTSLVLGLATVVALFVLGLPQNQGKVHHYHNVVWFLAVLAVSPCGAVLSLDALRRGRAGQPSHAPPAGALAALRYVWALMGVLYLFPGLAKLVAAVTDGWASAENQRLILWNKWLQLEWYESAIRPMVRPDTLPDPVLTVGALAVIVGEICVGAAMMFRRTRLTAVVVGLGFHLSTALAMGIFFSWLTPAYIGLIDWSRLVRRSRSGDSLSPPRSPAQWHRARSLHVVGIGLLAAEIAVSALQLLTMAPNRFLPQRQRVAEFLTSYHAQGFTWPFDAYPFFTSDGPTEISMLEIRLVEGDGRERGLPPAAFEAAVGRSSASAGLTRRLARMNDPAVRRVASRRLAEALWTHMAPEERRGAQGLRIYVSHVHMATIPSEPSERTLLLEIPADVLDTARPRLRQ
jgi:hypothetical protein